MAKSTLQKIKDILDLPGTLGIGLTLLEILIIGGVFFFNRQEKTSDSNSNVEYELIHSNHCSIYEAVNEGRLRYGMTIDEVINMLGQPRTRQSNRVGTYLYYGKYQLVFDSNGMFEHYNYN